MNKLIEWKELKGMLESYMSFPMMSELEGETLYQIATETKSKTIVELGIETSTSTKILLMVCKQLGGKLISIDNFSLLRSGANKSRMNIVNDLLRLKDFITEFNLEKYWVTLIGDSKKLYKKVKKEVGEGIDLLVIDSSHQYSDTLDELRLYIPLLKKTGIVYLHDTLHRDHYKDINLAILGFLMDEKEKNLNVWSYSCFQTTNGIGILKNITDSSREDRIVVSIN